MIEKLKEIKSISDIKNLKPNIGKKQEPPKPNKPNNKYSFRFKKFKDLRIGAKLITTFLIIAVVANIAGVISISVMNNIIKEYNDTLINSGFSQGDIGKAMNAFSKINGEIHNVLSFTYVNSQDDAIHEFDDLIKQAQEKITYEMTKVKPTLKTDEQKTMFSTIVEELNQYESVANDILSKVTNTTNRTILDNAKNKVLFELDPIATEISKNFDDLMTSQVNIGNEKSTDLANYVTRSTVFLIVVMIIACVLPFIFTVLLSKNISRSIGSCANRLKLLANGDLHTAVPVIKSKDETGMLASTTKVIVDTFTKMIKDLTYTLKEISNGNFNIESNDKNLYKGDFKAMADSIYRILDNLTNTISQINQSADQVASGSEQVSSGSQALAQGATEQASGIEELSATITEITEHIRENANNAATAKQETDKSSSEVTKSNQHMQDMMLAMNQINEKSNEIVKIIKTIDDIAFQTNILALNAAVEAARAGAAGRGFAVVADEVRNLAGKSAEAAKTTSSLIEETILAVKKGSKIADNTEKALLNVVESSQSVAVMVDQIAVASDQQAVAANQLTQTVSQISNVVQNNSATAEESAAASEELSGQAQLLKNLVGKFKLKNSKKPEEATFEFNEINHSPKTNLNHASDKYGSLTTIGSK